MQSICDRSQSVCTEFKNNSHETAAHTQLSESRRKRWWLKESMVGFSLRHLSFNLTKIELETIWKDNMWDECCRVMLPIPWPRSLHTGCLAVQNLFIRSVFRLFKWRRQMQKPKSTCLVHLPRPSRPWALDPCWPSMWVVSMHFLWCHRFQHSLRRFYQHNPAALPISCY